MLAHYDSISKIALGHYFKEKRQAAKMRQVDLAKNLGLKSSQHISNVERGASTFTASQVVGIAKSLSIELDTVQEVLLKESVESFKRNWQQQLAKEW